MAAPTTARRSSTTTAPNREGRGARPPLRLVDDARRKAAHRRRRARLVVVVAALLAAGTLFLLAAFNAMLVTGQSRIDHLQKKVAEAQTEYSANRLKVAQLEAPSHIVEVAQQRLGMVPPPGVTYLTPSEAMAAQVDRGAAHASTTTPDTTAKRDGGASWAAAKPYLGGNP